MPNQVPVNVNATGNAFQIREAIAREVDRVYGGLHLDTSFEELRIAGTLNRGPLSLPTIKLCAQTLGDSVRAISLDVFQALAFGGGSGGGEGGGGSGGGLGYEWVPIYGTSRICVSENVCTTEVHIIGWMRRSSTQNP